MTLRGSWQSSCWPPALGQDWTVHLKCGHAREKQACLMFRKIKITVRYLDLSSQVCPWLAGKPQNVAPGSQKPLLSSGSPAVVFWPTGPEPPWLHCAVPSVDIHPLCFRSKKAVKIQQSFSAPLKKTSVCRPTTACMKGCVYDQFTYLSVWLNALLSSMHHPGNVETNSWQHTLFMQACV